LSLERTVKVLIQPLGRLDVNALGYVIDRLRSSFKLFDFKASRRHMEIPEHSYNHERGQYDSSMILEELYREYSRGVFESAERVVGVADVDAYVYGLNFVFGEAQLGGPVAVVYLARLKPEFYGRPPDHALYVERICKEVIHELGHTMGLRHCPNPRCVMHFSNSIFDTDYKLLGFCLRCQSLIRRIL